MGNHTVGLAGAPEAFMETIIPGFNFFGSFNSGTGSHSFTFGPGSVNYVTGAVQTYEGTDDFAGFMALSASVWTLKIDGLIHASVGSVDPSTALAGLGMFLANGGSTGLGKGLTTVTVGSEGGLYGKFAGIQSNTAFSLTNSGTIAGGVYGIYTAESEATAADGVTVIAGNLELSRTGGPRTITVTNAVGAEIFGANAAIFNDTLSALAVTNAGQITGGQRAVDFRGDGGNYTSTASFGVASYGRLSLTNSASGTIDGGVMGAWLGSTVTNAGTINGTVETIVLNMFLNSDTGRIDVNRDGDFTDAGDFLIGDSRLVGMTLTNSGILNGYDGFYIETNPSPTDENPGPLFTKVAFDGSNLREVISNTAAGVIYGDVYMNGGNDSFTNAGLVFGTIATDDGNDVVTNAATGEMYAGDTTDIALHMGAGDDSFTNTGNVTGFVVMAEGSDTLSNSGALEKINMDRMFEDDGTTFRMTAGADGNDVVTLNKSSVVDGPIYLGFGNNSLSNRGIIDGEVIEFDEGTEITRAVNAIIVGRADNDSVTNFAQIFGGIDLGDGANRLVNSGRILDDMPTWGNTLVNPDNLSHITMGSGNDTITNTGEMGEFHAMFLNNRRVSTDLMREFLTFEDPELGAVISTGAGNDVVSNLLGKVSGKVYGVISTGAGDDTVTGGAFNEIVSEDEGRDVYRLGGGADAVIFSTADAFADTIDGGLGSDLLGFAFAAEEASGRGHRIDLAAGRIVYDVAGASDTVGGAGLGVDLISNFEQVLGTVNNDFIFGGAAAETLHGGHGDDIIVGGLGRDVLTGGSGSDSFVFNLATHSAASRATRDVITDFTVGDGDLIVFDFDSNTRAGTDNAGVQNEFTLGNLNGVFGGTAGEVRYYYLGQSTVVEVDTNGDKRADFSLALLWADGLAINLDASNFVFGPLP